MPKKDLKNKPLVEAILEVRWVLPQPQGIQGDPHYGLLLGRFSERVQADYPFHEPLPTTQIPDALAAHMVQHRFRAGAGAWPLLQIGPGIMTVNETDGYTWNNFRFRCEKAISSLYDAHPAKDKLDIQDLALRYIDAIAVDFSQENLFDFLGEKMKTTFSLPKELFDSGHVKSIPAAFNWQASFPNDDPGGTVTLRFALGQRKNHPALVWETLVQTTRERLPQMPLGFPSWLAKAHDLTDDWFFKLIEGELEKRFSGE